MNEAMDRAARAAFWNWRQMPKVTEGEMQAVWDTMPDAAKEPWRRTARMVIEAIAEPSAEMVEAGAAERFDSRYESEKTHAKSVWDAMIEELLK